MTREGDVVDAVSVGARIRKIRQAAGYSQVQMADKVHVSESYITLIELGKRNASLEVLVAIAEVLGTTLDYLVFGKREIQQGLYRDWVHLMEHRTLQEIQSAHTLVREFFACLDSAERSD